MITRRMQFRMKKNKKEAKQKKKEKKQQEKIEKEKAKEEKKKARDLKKQEAEAKKDAKKQKKADSEQKTKTEKSSRKRKQAKAFADEPKVDNKEEEVEKEAEKEQGQVSEELDEYDCPRNESPVVETRQMGKVRKHVKCIGLTKLRTMQAATPSPKKEPCQAKGKKRTRKERESDGSTKAFKGKVPKKGTKKGTGLKNCKKGSQKKPSTNTKKPSTKKPSSKRGKKAAKVDPCPKISADVTETLKSCWESSCTHPSWTMTEYDKKVFQVVIYWTRNAVGVKVNKASLEGGASKGCRGKKSKRKASNGWQQVGYFSGKTPCIYTNMLLASRFAT